MKTIKHSWHSSGTFAVVCLMTGKVVTSYSTPLVESTSANVTGAVPLQDFTYGYSPMQVATAVTLMVGIFQVNMYHFIGHFDHR